MTDDEIQDLLDLQAGIKYALAITEEQLILYPVDADDSEHEALIRKAVHYRDLLKVIKRKLNRAEL
jgi:hypothetical protein